MREISHKIFYLLSIFVVLTPLSVEAASTITRGQNATIEWSVSGATGCLPSLPLSNPPTVPTNDNLPNASVVSQWTSGSKDGTGNQSLGPFTTVGTFLFWCEEDISNQYDYDTVTVNDCGGGTVWDGDSCEVPACGNGANNPPTCNTCDVPYIYNGSSCVMPPGTGDISASTSTCYIAIGNTTCDSDITWTTSDTPSASVTYSGGTLWTGTSGTQTGSIPYGGRTFYLLDAWNNTIDQETVNAVCAAGSTWDGSVCLQNANGILYTTASPCTIAIGGSTCNVTLHWSGWIGVATPRVFNDTTEVQLSTALNNASGIAASVTNGTTTFEYREDTTGLRTAQGAGVCATGSTWNGSICEADPPSGTINANPTSCEILPSASTCNTVISWSTLNTPSASVVKKCDAL
jgi:hypothetical protein